MLVLTRRPFTGWDKIVVADGLITITILEVNKMSVRVGITAPDDIPIHREEVWLRIQQEQGEGEVTNADDRVGTAEVPSAANETLALPSEVRSRRRRSRVR